MQRTEIPPPMQKYIDQVAGYLSDNSGISLEAIERCSSYPDMICEWATRDITREQLELVFAGDRQFIGIRDPLAYIDKILKSNEAADNDQPEEVKSHISKHESFVAKSKSDSVRYNEHAEYVDRNRDKIDRARREAMEGLKSGVAEKCGAPLDRYLTES